MADPRLLPLALAAPLAAQDLVEVGDDVQFSSYYPSVQAAYIEVGAVVHNPDVDEFLIVLRSPFGTVAVQRVDASDGSLIGSITPVSGAFVSEPAAAYNPLAQEYLVVWARNSGGGAEVWAQRLDGATGTKILPSDYVISQAGPPGHADYGVEAPEVACNTDTGEYLVVWVGDDDDAGSVAGDFEVRGQLLDAAGQEIGADDFPISSLGPAGSTAYDAHDPDLVYNPDAGEYLVSFHARAWSVPGQDAVHVQRLAADGTQVGVDDAVLSVTAAGLGVAETAVAYAPVTSASGSGRYLVVWLRETSAALEGMRMFGQLLDGASGVEVGGTDVPLTEDGHGAWMPELAWVEGGGVFQAVWGRWETGYPSSGEVYSRLVEPVGGTPVGPEVRLSHTDPRRRAAGDPAAAPGRAGGNRPGPGGLAPPDVRRAVGQRADGVPVPAHGGGLRAAAGGGRGSARGAAQPGRAAARRGGAVGGAVLGTGGRPHRLRAGRRARRARGLRHGAQPADPLRHAAVRSRRRGRLHRRARRALRRARTRGLRRRRLAGLRPGHLLRPGGPARLHERAGRGGRDLLSSAQEAATMASTKASGSKTSSSSIDSPVPT